MSVAALAAHGPMSCASCARTDCRLSFVSRDIAPVPERVAFVLDEAWPEHRRFVEGQAKPGDQRLRPGLPGRPLPRYNWGAGTRCGVLSTARRHWTMRRVAAAKGAVRQAAYLRDDERLALALARRVDHHARHLVVSQTLLPFLWREGLLGGRTFDVLMTRYPLAELHARLDAVHAAHPDSATAADFRAPRALVAAEAEALAAARRLVTPHHDIAEAFGARAVWLDWDRPGQRERRPGDRVAFLGPSIARQGAHHAREIARALPSPLLVFGSDLEGLDFWAGVAIERRAFAPGWLDGVGAILHPAAVTHAPRRLLEAVAHGVAVYAHPSCGLAPAEFRPVADFAA